jgi:hypothetical protein
VLFVSPDHSCGNGASFGHVRHQAKSAAVNRAYHALLHPVVVDGLSSCLDSAVECRRGDVLVAPHCVEQLVFRHNSITTADQVREHVEDLRLNMHALASTSKFVQARVELVIAERIDQVIGNRYRHLITDR